MNPRISVVLCTYNNADSLKLTLLQLAAQQLRDPNEVEFIIINNNSCDNTLSVTENVDFGQFCYNYFNEPQQGLSHARNLGVAKARGEYILFTDDDAEIQPNWIQIYLDYLVQKPVDCVFGKISIIWDMSLPWWYDDRYKGFFSAIDHGNEPFAVTSWRHPFFGKNFCVKKSVIGEIGGFDPRLGRKGSELLGGEETALFNYLLSKNNAIWYCPGITVGHRLKEREYTVENIRKQHLACAKPIILFSYQGHGKKLLGRNLLTLKDHLIFIIEYGFAYLKAWRKNDKKEKFFLRLEIHRAFRVIWYWFLIKKN